MKKTVPFGDLECVLALDRPLPRLLPLLRVNVEHVDVSGQDLDDILALNLVPSFNLHHLHVFVGQQHPLCDVIVILELFLLHKIPSFLLVVLLFFLKKK